MNRRIHPDELGNTPFKELLQGLALEWIHAELPTQGLAYGDCLTTIRILLLTTQSPERTAMIVRAVLTQAVALHKTAEWVDQELKFEGMLEGADRVDFLAFDLQQTGSMDDQSLDLYNERMSRFSPSAE